MSAPQKVGPAGPKPPVPWLYWPYWLLLLGVALVLFYLILTPVWMGVRFVAWLSERGRSEDVEQGTDKVTRTRDPVSPGGPPG